MSEMLEVITELEYKIMTNSLSDDDIDGMIEIIKGLFEIIQEYKNLQSNQQEIDELADTLIDGMIEPNVN